ncbi:MAG TPA: benenodin family lasso peptide [Sphingomonas sp.]
MEREDLVDLGAASIETKGAGIVLSDGKLGQEFPGLSDD